MRVLLLVLLLTVPAYAGPGGYFSDANNPPRVSVPGTGFSLEKAIQAPTVVPPAGKTATVLPAQVSAPVITVPTITVPPSFPGSVPPVLTAPQDLPPGVTTPGRPLPTGPAGY